MAYVLLDGQVSSLVRGSETFGAKMIGTETTRNYSVFVRILMEHMPRKHTRQCFLQTFRRAILILLLSVSAGIVLPHKAESQENREQRWKHAQEVVFSGDSDMDDVIKSYPFLKKDFQEVKDMQKQISEAPPGPTEPKDYSVDVSAPVRIAKSMDKETGINIVFVSIQGSLNCGSHGCSLAVYVDKGRGYKKALDIVAFDSVHISRANGQISLFFEPDNNGKMPLEWILKGNSFEANAPLQ